MRRWELDNRRGLLKAGAVFYTAVLALASLLVWATGVDLRPQLQFRIRDLAIGAAAVIPLLPIFFIAVDLRDLVADYLGKPLSECRWMELAFLAGLAGAAEELLFRGVLQEWWGRYDFWIGVIAVNVVFGLLHAVTPLYCLIATAVGFYFSFLAELSEPRSIVIPIVAHAVYDFIGFLLIARDYRCEQSNRRAVPSDESPPI